MASWSLTLVYSGADILTHAGLAPEFISFPLFFSMAGEVMDYHTEFMIETWEMMHVVSQEEHRDKKTERLRRERTKGVGEDLRVWGKRWTAELMRKEEYEESRSRVAQKE